MTLTVSTVEAQKNLYPTPPGLAKKLLAGLNWGHDGIRTILEPSAGTGNLVKAIASRVYEYSHSGEYDVDMIELDPELRGILTDTFNETASDLAYRQKEELRQEYLVANRNNEPTDAIRDKWMEAEKAYYSMKSISPRIVHDDFLTYDSRKQYDLIVMNPPFDQGDLHLLKAIQMQKRYGGQIRCILNAATIQNPCSNRRQMLVDKLHELGAEISVEEGAFKDAERQANVDVVIIKIDIPDPVHKSDIYERLVKDQEQQEASAEAPTSLVENDFITQIIRQYKLEVDTGCELIRQYNAVIPYIQASFGEENSPIIRLAVNSAHAEPGKPSINKFLKAVRMKYWKALFEHPSITRQLTSNLSDELHGNVQKLQDYDFSEYNVRQMLCEINCKMEQAVQETIMDLFDTLTAEHAWYPECQKNIHYYNGWASNKAHKINKKVVIPAHGIFDTYSWTQDAFNTYNAYSFLSDIEKSLNYLDGGLTIPVNLERQLRYANDAGKTKNIQLKYFDVSFYKKGTAHIQFTNLELLDRLNIYASRKKSWLPPYYGRKTYQNMDEEEKAVVDSFHGDGTPGSGEADYSKVLAKADYYLTEPNTAEQLMLPEG